MKKYASLCLLLSFCAVFLMVAGCDDGGSSSSTSPATLYDVTGTWEVATSSVSSNLVLHLSQDAQGTITGTADRSSTLGYDYGTVIAGSNNNNTIYIHVLFTTHHFEFNGTVNDANNMGGMLENYYEPKDQNRVYEEAWTATRSQ
jgi:hypothetical protein